MQRSGQKIGIGHMVGIPLIVQILYLNVLKLVAGLLMVHGLHQLKAGEWQTN